MNPARNSSKALAALFIFCILTATSSGALFIAQYRGTVETSSISGAAPNDPITYLVTIDNGGTSSLWQSWTLADIISVRFLAGTLDATFSLAVGDDVAGEFETNGTGELISIPRFGAPTNGLHTILASNFVATNYQLFINGLNSVLYINDFTSDITELDPSSNQFASLWTLTPAPEPSKLSLLALGILGILSRRRPT
jgi:hypothetical protein